MRLNSAGDIRYYQSQLFDPDTVVHAVFARHGGVSPEPYATLNMSITTGDTRENVRENRGRALRALERDPASSADLWQVHSADVIVAEAPTGPQGYLGKADSLITDRPEVTLCLRFADCVPVLLYDPRRPAVGLVHSGWRGTLLRAAPAAVRAMAERFGSRPGDLRAVIGPSIGPCHYPVGPEVVEQTRQVFPGADDELLQRVNSHVHLDLWAANARNLREAGVEQIEVAGICTACHTDDFFSYRAAGGKTGAFAAVIGLR